MQTVGFMFGVLIDGLVCCSKAGLGFDGARNEFTNRGIDECKSDLQQVTLCLYVRDHTKAQTEGRFRIQQNLKTESR